MEVQFVCPEGSDLTQLKKAYPDLFHDDTCDGRETWLIGKSGDEYWDPDRDLYNYGEDGPEDLSEQRDDSKEWMTAEGAAEFCGFAETLIEGSDTLLEGNGGWAQGQLRKDEDYLRGVRKAQELLQPAPAVPNGERNAPPTR